VLIVRVHPESCAARAAGCARTTRRFWHDRYRSIVDLERHLHANGTRIIKFFLHLSKDEQRKRFLARIDEPEKNWKFSLADIEERKFWKHYMKAYEEVPQRDQHARCALVRRSRRRQGERPADRIR
jgi:polyphosphate kinase 2 (PPK2 family)